MTYLPRIDEIAILCKEHNIAHLVNNAFGVQSSKAVKLISRACSVGRVDAFIQSTDKNFMVPVGGAVIASPKAEFIAELSRLYPGRASIAPVLDLFITLLSMGSSGYTRLLHERKVNYEYLKKGISEVVKGFGCALLETPSNDVSLGRVFTFERHRSNSFSDLFGIHQARGYPTTWRNVIYEKCIRNQVLESMYR